MPAFGQKKLFVFAARRNVQEILLMVLANKRRPSYEIMVLTTFRQQQNLSREICEGKLLDPTHEKVNLSRKHFKEDLLVGLNLTASRYYDSC
jgi:hypothetical protein